MDKEAWRTGRALARVLAVAAILYGAFDLGAAGELGPDLSGSLLSEGSTVIGATLLVLVGLLLLSLSRKKGPE